MAGKVLTAVVVLMTGRFSRHRYRRPSRRQWGRRPKRSWPRLQFPRACAWFSVCPRPARRASSRTLPREASSWSISSRPTPQKSWRCGKRPRPPDCWASGSSPIAARGGKSTSPTTSPAWSGCRPPRKQQCRRRKCCACCTPRAKHSTARKKSSSRSRRESMPGATPITGPTTTRSPRIRLRGCPA